MNNRDFEIFVEHDSAAAYLSIDQDKILRSDLPVRLINLVEGTTNDKNKPLIKRDYRWKVNLCKLIGRHYDSLV